MKDLDGFVLIKGLAKGGASGSTVFQLPAGYRPLATLYGTPQSTGGTGFGDLTIDNLGNVKVFNIGSANVTSYCGLNMYFRAEQ